MESAAGLIGQGLGQEAGVEAVAGGHGPDDLLEQEDVVGSPQGACVVEINLVLAVAALVVAVLGRKAHLLHGQADVPAQVLACIQRGHIEIAACVDGDAGGTAMVVVLEEIELALSAYIAAQAQISEPAVDVPQEAAAVAAEGGVVRLFHVAEELHHPPLGGAPGQDGRGGQVGPEDKVALLHMHEARNGAAVEADALFQRLGQVAGQHGDVLLNAKDVTEREADKFYVVVLDEIEDVLLCRIAHSVSS